MRGRGVLGRADIDDAALDSELLRRLEESGEHLPVEGPFAGHGAGVDDKADSRLTRPLCLPAGRNQARRQEQGHNGEDSHASSVKRR